MAARSATKAGALGAPTGRGVIALGRGVARYRDLPHLVVLQVADRLVHGATDTDLATGEGLGSAAVVLGDDVGVGTGPQPVLVQDGVEEPDGRLALRLPGGVGQGHQPGRLRGGGRGAADNLPAPGGVAAVVLGIGGDPHVHAAVHRRVPGRVGEQAVVPVGRVDPLLPGGARVDAAG